MTALARTALLALAVLAAAAAGQTLVEVPGTPARALTWTTPEGTWWQASADGGATYTEPRRTSFDLALRYARFDPLAAQPEVPPALAATDSSRLRIVQYAAPALPAMRAAVQAAGATRLFHLPHHANLVEIDPERLPALAALPFVRWIGPYHPAYRMFRDDFGALDPAAPAAVWNLVATRKHDLAAKVRIANDLSLAGGRLFHPAVRESFLLTMILPPSALRAALAHDEVLWVDRWSPLEPDMDVARAATGALYVSTVPGGFQGQGVRGEVPDIGCLDTHVDFAGIAWHGTTAVNSHGTSTYGIVFGQGVGDPQGLGLLPQGQGFAGYIYDPLFASNRYAYTAELLTPPYECVFQSNSTGGNWTTAYGSTSMQMDDIIFDLDFPILQSQSNQGTQLSRPEAWAKNVISVGGVYHFNTLARADDGWNNGASIGPAEDGRVKPDVCNYYDQVFTATSTSNTAYTNGFNGTSAATPITAGCLGITIQMWASGVFGPTNPGSTVFAKRPHASTAKALLVNNANQYPFSGLNHDLTRMHQGWGSPDLARTYDRAAAGKVLVVDETVTLPPLQSVSWLVDVAAGEPDLRATLVWSDPPGTTSAAQHRINDLDLKVTSPAGVAYWGNAGLLAGTWSTPGGSPNSLDTVENVFVQNPQAGTWSVTVFAVELNQDGHVETGAVDADFALVVTGAAAQAQGPPDVGQANSAAATLFVNGGTNLNGEPAFAGIPGPFFATATAGGTLAFTFAGAANADVILVLGPLHRNNAVFPGVGSLDVGLLGPGDLSDVAVLLDGTADVTVLDQLASTGPLGQSTLGFTVPVLPLGILGTFQAAVVPLAQPPLLTAAFQLTIN
jgi:serine protease AprX